MLSIKPSSNILVVVAHPDDEWWGLGGTLLRLEDEYRASISIIMVSDGDRGDGTGKERLDGSRDLCKEVGFDFKCFNVPANTLNNSVPNITLRLDHKLVGFKPDIIFSHFEGDTHLDHKTVDQCVLASLRGWPKVTYLQIETPFKDGFLANFWVNISDYVSDKFLVYEDYFNNEIKQRKEYSVNHIKNVNRFRGQNFGVEYAEGFFLKMGGI